MSNESPSDVNPERWILIVEDNPDDENLARRAFAASGNKEKMVVANDGQDALDLLKKEEVPILVLLDLKLPRLSGVDVLMAMRDDERLQMIPVVVLTSSQELSDIAACYELGCNAYINKPVDYTDFMQKLAVTFSFWINTNLTFPAKSPHSQETESQPAAT